MRTKRHAVLCNKDKGMFGDPLELEWERMRIADMDVLVDDEYSRRYTITLFHTRYSKNKVQYTRTVCVEVHYTTVKSQEHYYIQ